MKSNELNFLDYFAILIKWRKLIVYNFVVVCIVAIGLSFIMPKWYKAQTTLMPPVEQSISTFGLASVLGELPFSELGLPGMTSSAEIFKAIIESRKVATAVIEKWNLMEVYKKKEFEHAIATLWDHSRVEITQEGLIKISVEERNPELAAGLANSFVEELDRVNQTSTMSQAKNTRIFVEKRLEESQDSLRIAEEALRIFQEENQTVSLPEQIAAVIQNVAELKTKQVSLEVEKGVLSKTSSSTHPQILRLQSEIEELQEQINQLTIGALKAYQQGEGDQINDKGDFNIPLSEVPSVGLRLARLTREVKIQEAVFELLTQQYEQAKIQEAKNTPTVQVLDRAVPPKIRSKPVRRIIVIFWAALSILFSFIVIGWMEYFNALKEKHQEEYRKLQNLLLELKTDLHSFIRKIGLRGRDRV